MNKEKLFNYVKLGFTYMLLAVLYIGIAYISVYLIVALITFLICINYGLDFSWRVAYLIFRFVLPIPLPF